MIELRKCLKYDWAWCDGVCENCTTISGSKTIQMSTMPPANTTYVVDISTDSINKIADAVIERLQEMGNEE